MKTISIGIFLASLVLSLPSLAQTSYPFCEEDLHAFAPGEKLEYTLYYHWNFVWIRAGTLKISFREVGDKYLIKAIGKTLDSYNWFFMVDDVYECAWDKVNLLPMRYKRDIREGNYRLENTIEFDYTNQQIRSTVSKNGGPIRNYFFPMGSCNLDLLSMIYKLRNIDLEYVKNHQKVNTELIFDEQKFPIGISYLGVELDRPVHGLGTFSLHKISPDLISGEVFREGSQMIIWVSNDKNRIPVLIETPLKVGSLKAVLSSFSGLKHPLTSLKTSEIR